MSLGLVGSVPVHADFEFSVVLSRILNSERSTKVKGPSLLCYLTGERWIHVVFFSKGVKLCFK